MANEQKASKLKVIGIAFLILMALSMLVTCVGRLRAGSRGSTVSEQSASVNGAVSESEKIEVATSSEENEKPKDEVDIKPDASTTTQNQVESKPETVRQTNGSYDGDLVINARSLGGGSTVLSVANTDPVNEYLLAINSLTIEGTSFSPFDEGIQLHDGRGYDDAVTIELAPSESTELTITANGYDCASITLHTEEAFWNPADPAPKTFRLENLTYKS